MKLNDNTLYKITTLAEHFDFNYHTLKEACQRWDRTGGKYGCKSIKPGHDWLAFPGDVKRYVDAHPHKDKANIA